MILIALAIVFGGLGALSLSKSDSTDSSATAVTPSVAAGTPRTNTPDASATPTSANSAESSESSSTASSASTTTSSSARGAADKSVPVRVYNNSSITGLAAKTASTLENDGWTIAETGNYAQGDIPKTTVYYGSSSAEQAAAKAIAAEIGATAEPRFAGIQGSGPGVIVIVTGS